MQFWCMLLSRIDPKRAHVTDDKTCFEQVLFQLSLFSLVPASKRFREAVAALRIKSGNSGISLPEGGSCYRRHRDGVLAVRSPEPLVRRNLQCVSATTPWLRRFFIRFCW